MHERAHCRDETANHCLPIAMAFWIIRIVPAEQCSSLMQNIFERDGHTVHTLTQRCLLPSLTSIVKSLLFMHGHPSPRSLAARLHPWSASCSHHINSGWTFSRRTSSYTCPLSSSILPSLSPSSLPQAYYYISSLTFPKLGKDTSLETGLDTKTIKLFSSPFFKNIALKTLEQQWRKEIVHNSLSISFCFFPILVHKSECIAWKEFCYIYNFSLLTFFLHSELLTF